jgi:hypothetical protein
MFPRHGVCVRAYLFYYISKLTSLMVYERSEYYSTSTAASENGHGPGTLYCSKMVYTGNGLTRTRTRALYHLGPPQLFRRTFKNYEKPE